MKKNTMTVGGPQDNADLYSVWLRIRDSHTQAGKSLDDAIKLADEEFKVITGVEPSTIKK